LSNKQQRRRFNEWPISELHGEVESIKASLKLLFPYSNNGMSHLSFSSKGKSAGNAEEIYPMEQRMTTAKRGGLLLAIYSTYKLISPMANNNPWTVEGLDW
jgi:hypothetical protein